MKQAYLTIDDAPSRDFKAKMEYLYRRNIPALFFCEGKRIRGNEEALQAAIQRGFLLGNHAHSHPHFSDLPVEKCKQEILKADGLIDTLYRSAGSERPAKYFRFPYFDDGGVEGGPSSYAGQTEAPPEPMRQERENKRIEIQEYLRALGYRHPPFTGISPRYYTKQKSPDAIDVRCTYDQQEYWLNDGNAPHGQSSEATIMARIEADDPARALELNRDDVVDIILLHDHIHTTDLFYKIIARYIEKGIQFLNIP